MKNIIIQLRLIISETFLGLAMKIAPNTKDGMEIVKLVRDYFRKVIKKGKK